MLIVVIGPEVGANDLHDSQLQLSPLPPPSSLAAVNPDDTAVQHIGQIHTLTQRETYRQTHRLSVSLTHIDTHLDDTAVQHTGQIHTPTLSSTTHWTDHTDTETDIQTDAQTISVSDTHRHTSR